MPDKRRHGRRAASFGRRVNTRPVRQRFLIVCEGTKTEPNYFKAFRAPGKVEAVVRGLGDDPLNLVNRAIELWNSDEYGFDQVWCVFDRDSVPADSFNAAITIVESKRMRVAYSNEAFELWYLLHFQECSTAIPRRDYITRQDEALRHPYKKNGETMYDELLERQEVAIKNAERLLARYSPRNPAGDNPSTTVHLLVQQLNKYAR